MKIRLIAITFACIFQASAENLVAPKQIGNLVLDDQLTLLDVFASGLRPYRVTVNRCEVDSASLRLEFPNGTGPVIIDVSHVSFAVDRKDRIRRMELSTEAKGVAAAADDLRRLGAVLRLDLDGLDAAVLRAEPSNPRWPDTWTQVWSGKRATARLAFQPMTYFSSDATKGHREMRAIAHFTFEWEQTEIGPTFRRDPIQPPKGYEHVSMEVPNSALLKRVQGSTDPAYAHLQSKPAPAAEDKPPASETSIAPQISHPEPLSTPPPSVETPTKLFHALWWLIGGVMALLTVIVIVQRKRPKT